MKKIRAIATLTVALMIYSTTIRAGEGAPTESATSANATQGTELVHWELDVEHKGGKIRFAFFVNPDHAIQTPGGGYVCTTYTPTGRGNAYKRVTRRRPLDLGSPRVDIGIDSRGRDRIEMHRLQDGWWQSDWVACDKVEDGFNVIFTFGRVGPFGRGKMSWLCYDESLRRGEGAVKYNGQVLSLTSLQEGSGPIAFDSYKTPDGKDDGFLTIKACNRR